jgi:hypothetical protein
MTKSTSTKRDLVTRIIHIFKFCMCPLKSCPVSSNCRQLASSLVKENHVHKQFYLVRITIEHQMKDEVYHVVVLVLSYPTKTA